MKLYLIVAVRVKSSLVRQHKKNIMMYMTYEGLIASAIELGLLLLWDRMLVKRCTAAWASF